MLKDTLTDYQKHAWNGAPISSEDIEKKINDQADLKTSQLAKETEGRIEDILSRFDITDGQINELRSEVKEVVNTAIVESSHITIEKEERTLERFLHTALAALTKGGREPITWTDFYTFAQTQIYPQYSINQVVKAMDLFAAKGYIELIDNVGTLKCRIIYKVSEDY